MYESNDAKNYQTDGQDFLRKNGKLQAVFHQGHLSLREKALYDDDESSKGLMNILLIEVITSKMCNVCNSFCC